MILFFPPFNYKFSYNWWSLRLFAILSTPIFFVELEFLFLIQGFILSHAYYGLSNIIKDYIHNISLQLLFLSMFRILIIESVSLIINFWQ